MLSRDRGNKFRIGMVKQDRLSFRFACPVPASPGLWAARNQQRILPLPFSSQGAVSELSDSLAAACRNAQLRAGAGGNARHGCRDQAPPLGAGHRYRGHDRGVQNYAPHLTLQKARILLMLALSRTHDDLEIRQIFERY